MGVLRVNASKFAIIQRCNHLVHKIGCFQWIKRIFSWVTQAKRGEHKDALPVLIYQIIQKDHSFCAGSSNLFG